MFVLVVLATALLAPRVNRARRRRLTEEQIRCSDRLLRWSCVGTGLALLALLALLLALWAWYDADDLIEGECYDWSRWPAHAGVVVYAALSGGAILGLVGFGAVKAIGRLRRK
jgi:hypothetical protein